MKLQHTSGAVIENNLLKETEGLYPAFVQYDAFDKVVAKYPKADWRRVPEERFVKCKIEIERSTIDCILVDGERWRNIASWDSKKYSVIDGNLCVERRVEG